MIATLADLRSWAVNGPPTVDGQRPGLAVIGDPVSHSLSPSMHQPALDAAGRGLAYIKLHLRPGELAEGFRLLAALGFIGCNVTVPHKREALEACSQLTDHARWLGVVNTVSFTPDGPHGANTDGPGLVAALEDAFGLTRANLSRLRVLLLGAGGGAGQATAIELALAGVRHLTLANRSAEKLPALAQRISEVCATAAVPAPANLSLLGLADSHPTQTQLPDAKPAEASPNHLAEVALQAELILHASNLGRHPADPLPVPADALHPGQWVMDLVYRPGGTPLVHAAQAAGARAVDGLPLLLHQGALAQEIWFGQAPDLELMRSGLEMTRDSESSKI